MKYKRKYSKPKQGYYKLNFPDRFKMPVDSFMNSTKMIDGSLCVQYKSGLELKAFKYCDNNPKIKEWSLEPFHIPYMSPIDGKSHRYFPDIWIRFSNDTTFIVEIKSSSETKMPRKNDKRYSSKLSTYLTNQAKWQAANNFAQANNSKFIVLTEKVLG